MVVVLFVHGTGSREPEYGAVLSRIRRGLARAGADAQVRPCYWGATCGAWLRAGGLSVPAGESDRAIPAPTAAEPDGDLDSWACLERDPLLELRLHATGPAAELPPGAVTPGRELAAIAAGLPQDRQLIDELAAVDLVDAFCEAVPMVLAAEPTQAALLHATAGGDQGGAAAVATALARAFVATALVLADERLGGCVPVDGVHRDRVLAVVTDRLGAGSRGIGGAALRLALAMGLTRPVERRREAVTRALTPFAGDVLVYLVRGDAIRAHIEAAVRQAGDRVVLLAHSLGGIAAVDLLVTTPLPAVATLVTVGSQAPYLYELDALPSLRFGQRLPEHFPRWVNVHDRRDLLAYQASSLFDDRVSDVPVDTRTPFPRSHSAYFGHAGFYDRLATILATAGATGVSGVPGGTLGAPDGAA